jgi:hypothetical protein
VRTLESPPWLHAGQNGYEQGVGDMIRGYQCMQAVKRARECERRRDRSRSPGGGRDSMRR